MAMTNHERVGKGMNHLRDGLKPFVERELQASLRSDWVNRARQALVKNMDWRQNDDQFLNDVQGSLVLMWEFWNDVFRNTLGHTERSLVSELRTTRNAWAHQQSFSSDDAYRALDSMHRLLTAVSAKDEAREVDKLRQELLRQKFEEQARSERRKAAAVPLEGQPTQGLRSWREVVTPHPDVASGRYQEAEFAADLAAVYDKASTAGHEYRDPVEFFARTYLTNGLQYLLKNSLLRISQNGGDPVVELHTNFGGGKTHAMLALYHLFSGTLATKLAGVDGLLNELGMTELPTQVKRAVLVGTALSPSQPVKYKDGLQAHTLWGVMALQLGGAEGYKLVEQSDLQGTAPGSSVLRELLERFSPCLILIDEWVSFVRQLYQKVDIPAGSFEANLSFAQSLTEAVKQVPGALVVASLPASDNEVGGEGGREALNRLRNVFGRVESAWRPATAEEGFEIVRRRLFQPLREPQKFVARDNVVNAFAEFYREQSAEFPKVCAEADYKRRMTAAYPIHPELFDRLYEGWSTIDKFQRTRGVLRFMAQVISQLWDRNDGGLLIMPSSIPLDSGGLSSELNKYLDDHWEPIISKDIDGPSSLPLDLDRENPNLGRYSACRRVARTIFMGSAPTVKTRPGIEEKNIKLGCAQPGEAVAIFGDALRRLYDRATHLYQDRNLYWYSTQPSVARLAYDRASQIELVEVWNTLKARLRQDRSRGELAGVHITPDSSGDVPDEAEARLVILRPEFTHTNKQANSPAVTEALHILKQRGTAPRLNQNMLVFLAPDQTQLSQLEESIRQVMAWDSIAKEQDALNLDTFQRNQAQARLAQAHEAVKIRIPETFVWLLVPTQEDPRDARSLVLESFRLSGPDSLAVKVSRKLLNDELLITGFSAVRLQMDMQKFNLWQGKPHLNLKQLWEYFARYPYLPRLRNGETLRKAVQDGVTTAVWVDCFAYASAWDEAKQRYVGLVAGRPGEILQDNTAVLVQPAVAQAQIELESKPLPISGIEEIPPVYPDITRPGPVVAVPPLPTPNPQKEEGKRFYGTIELNPLNIGRDIGPIIEAVIRHLVSQPDAKVTICLDIEAKLPHGASEQLVRTVKENSKTLKFKNAEFDDLS